MSAHLKATSIFIVALRVGGLGVAPAPPTASPRSGVQIARNCQSDVGHEKSSDFRAVTVGTTADFAKSALFRSILGRL